MTRMTTVTGEEMVHMSLLFVAMSDCKVSLWLMSSLTKYPKDPEGADVPNRCKGPQTAPLRSALFVFQLADIATT